MKKRAHLYRIDNSQVEIDGRKQDIIIDNITHIGRSNDLTIWSDKCTNDMIKDANVAIEIQDNEYGNTYVSRNHALIYPPKNDTDKFKIYDLYSMNGTYINGLKINPNTLVDINDHDEIAFGTKDARFIFLPIIKDINPNYGLMVGHHGGNLRGSTEDVLSLKSQLEQRGFNNNIETLFDDNASKENILDYLNVLKRKVTSESVFMFYFSGHGNKNGDLYIKEDRLKATELLNALSGYRGKILMILDGCYTEIISRYNFPTNAVLIGHKEIAYEGKVTGGVIEGYTTRAIIKILSKNPDRIDIKRLVLEIMKNTRVRTHQKIGSCHRTNIELRTKY